MANRWLAPTKAVASAIPKDGIGKLWLRVMEDDSCEYMAVDDSTHKCMTVERGDVTVFGIDWHRIAESIANHAGFARSSDKDSSKAVWHWATSQPQLAFSFPIFFSRGRLLDSLINIGDQTDTPFIVFRLKPAQVDGISGRILKERSGLLLSLCDSTQPTGTGGIELTDGGIDRIREFQARFLPAKPASVPHAAFPTPLDCKWSAIKIRFLDIDTVSITAAGASGRFHFAEMGFARSSNKRSNIQWDLLRSFAKGYGTLTWTSAGASRQNQKRKERLSETLRQFFGIAEDPIRWMPDRCGWQTLFAIEPES